MYHIKIEHQCVARWYVATSYTDAMELFNLLTKTCEIVQVWKGVNTIAEYNNRKEFA